MPISDLANDVLHDARNRWELTPTETRLVIATVDEGRFSAFDSDFAELAGILGLQIEHCFDIDSTVRAELLEWLLQHDSILSKLPGRRLHWDGLVLPRPLVLFDLAIPSHFLLSRSRLLGGLQFRGCELRTLTIVASHVFPHPQSDLAEALVFDNCRLQGALILADGNRVDGCLSIVDTTITGRLQVSSIEITNPHKVALRLRGTRVGSDVSLAPIRAGRTTAVGTVDIRSCVIDGNLGLEGLTSKHPAGVALDISSNRIRGTLSLRPSHTLRTEISGQVRMLNNEIGIDADFSGALITSEQPETVVLDGTRVAGCLWFSRRNEWHFECTGAIVMRNGRVGNDLIIGAATIAAPGSYGIHVQGTTVTGIAHIGHGEQRLTCKIDGGIRFVNCTLRGLEISNTSCWQPYALALRPIHALSIDSCTIQSSLSFGSGLDFHGTIFLVGTHARFLQDGPNLWNHSLAVAYELTTFDDISVAHLRRRLRILGDSSISTQPFEQLASVLRKKGLERDAFSTLIRRDQWRRRRHMKRFSVRWIIDVLFDVMMGYGHRPHRLLWLYLFSFAFWLAACIVADRFNIVTPRDPAAFQQFSSSGTLPAGHVGFSSLGMAVDCTLPSSPTLQASSWRFGTNDRSRPMRITTDPERSIPPSLLASVLDTLVMLFEFIAWLYVGLIIAAFTRLIRRI